MLEWNEKKLLEILKEPFQLTKDIELNKKVPIGLEIEFTKGNYDNIFKRVNSFSYYKDKYNKKWTTKNDGFNNEVVSPIFYNKDKDWDTLFAITDILKSCKAKPSENDSLQISFGLEIFNENKEALNRFFKLWKVFEKEIYRFSYGKEEKARMMLYQRALPISYRMIEYFKSNPKTNEKDYTFIEQIKDIGTFIPHQKLYAINIVDTKHSLTGLPERIELRPVNGTIDSFYIQNAIQFFSHFIESCQDDTKNWDLIDKKYEETAVLQENFYAPSVEEDYSTSLSSGQTSPKYREIIDAPPDLEEALLLGNFIYGEDNNFHRAYLKQYIKTEKSLQKMLK